MALLKPKAAIIRSSHIVQSDYTHATLLVRLRRTFFTLLLALLSALGVIWLYHERQSFVTSVFETVKHGGHSELVKHQAPSNSPAPKTTGVLDCFQVAQPVLGPGVMFSQPKANTKATSADKTTEPAIGSSCSIMLMDHVFGQSYGKPFIGNYTPPTCDFNRVIMNFTVVSEGRQFDRLALMYFGDAEVWRTSTAEPTMPPGIAWTYMKDMTHYMYFWKSPQTLIFDLGNNLDDKYTGSFNATLTATFFQSSVQTGGFPPADLIIPISQRLGVNGTPSAFIVPQQNTTNTMSLPSNVKRAVFSVSACGQADEEFWWSNFLQSDISAFDQTTGSMPGWSPFREIQVLIDGQLAGVQWPFPVIFTGGVVPSLHRPIVGLDAFDLQEHQIDVSPFLPLLCDGAQHTFTILVAGLDDDGHGNATLSGTVNSNWVVTGKLFLWLDDQNLVTVGVPPVVSITGPEISVTHAITRDSNGVNETLAYSLSVYRTLSVTGSTDIQNGGGNISWTQALSYTTYANVTEFGNRQINKFLITGGDTTTISTPLGPLLNYKSNYSYPLYVDSTESTSLGGRELRAYMMQGKTLLVEGHSVFPSGLEAFAPMDNTELTRSLLNTTREGDATFSQSADGKNGTGSGSTNQVFKFEGYTPGDSPAGDSNVELYFRNVTATNDAITSDTLRVAPQPPTTPFSASTSAGRKQSQNIFAEARGLSPGSRREHSKPAELQLKDA